VHPYTNADPGGWAWTDLPGGVPDADDTPGAMLALLRGGTAEWAEIGESIEAGSGWLLSLQNRDGGWPTFCRGWGTLPFDRSSQDITAHVLRALMAAEAVNPAMAARFEEPIRRVGEYEVAIRLHPDVRAAVKVLVVADETAPPVEDGSEGAAAEDAVQFLLAGATAVQVGTATFADPAAPARILRDLGRWCDQRGVASVAELVGGAHGR